MKLGTFKISVNFIVLCVVWFLLAVGVVISIHISFSDPTSKIVGWLLLVLFMLMNAVVVYKLIKLNSKSISQKEYGFLSMYLANPIPLWIYDLQTLKFVSVNDAAIEKYGYSKAEFLSMTINDILKAEDRQHVNEAVNQLSNVQNNYRIGQHQKKDGSIIHVNITSHKIRFEDKDCVMVMTSDSTERIRYEEELKRMNQQLSEEKQKLKETEKLAKVSGWEYYPGTHSLIWSEELYSLFDLEPKSEKVDYALVLKMVHPDDLTDYNKAVEALLLRQEELNIVYRFMTKMGKLKYIRVLGKACYQNDVFFKVHGTMLDVTELKIVQKEKNLYLRRLKVTLNNINDGYFHIDPNLNITDVNANSEKLLNIKRKDIVNKPLFTVFSEAKKPDLITQISKVLENKVPVQFEDYNLNTKKWFCVNAYPSGDGAAMYLNDITATKQKDTELKQALERYDLIAKATQDVIYDWDTINEKTEYGRNINLLLDMPADEVAGTKKDWWRERVCPDDLDAVVRKFKTCVENKETNIVVQYRLRTNSGVYKYVYDQGYLQYNKDQKLIRIIGAFKDIDQLKRFDEENKRLADIITKVNNMIIIQDVNDKIIWVNEAFEKTNGYCLSEVIGKTPHELLFGPETDLSYSSFILEARKNLERFSFQLINYTKQKKKYWVNIECTPLFTPNGKLDGFIYIHTDITLLKEKSEMISRQNEMLRNIAWMSSHELRKPVASILGLIELINETTDQAEKDESIQLMQTCTKYLDEIIHKINRQIEQEIFAE